MLRSELYVPVGITNDQGLFLRAVMGEARKPYKIIGRDGHVTYYDRAPSGDDCLAWRFTDEGELPPNLNPQDFKFLEDLIPSDLKEGAVSTPNMKIRYVGPVNGEEATDRFEDPETGEVYVVDGKNRWFLETDGGRQELESPPYSSENSYSSD